MGFVHKQPLVATGMAATLALLKGTGTSLRIPLTDSRQELAAVLFILTYCVVIQANWARLKNLLVVRRMREWWIRLLRWMESSLSIETNSVENLRRKKLSVKFATDFTVMVLGRRPRRRGSRCAEQLRILLFSPYFIPLLYFVWDCIHIFCFFTSTISFSVVTFCTVT